LLARAGQQANHRPWRLLAIANRDIAMTARVDTVFLFDVDNTLLDNDRIQADLRERLQAAHGDGACARYWEIFQEQWGAVGYADYFGALERLRLEDRYDRELPVTANWLLDYPFADRLYPHALDAVNHVRQWGSPAILSDGDAIFQPRKILRSGLWEAVDGNVLIYVHKEKELKDVERRYPAARYVLIDDKTRILAAVKAAWGERVTTIFPKQGHFAIQEPPRDGVSVDRTIDKIGDLLRLDLSTPKLIGRQ
jgi:FMN phosphatase YigB (HAD superfamily)